MSNYVVNKVLFFMSTLQRTKPIIFQTRP